MKKIFKMLLLLSVTGLCAADMADQQMDDDSTQVLNDGSPALLTIDGKTVITEKSFKNYIDNVIASNENPQLKIMLQLLPNAKQELFKRQVNEKMICYWAEKEGITNSTEYQEKYAQGLEVLQVGLAEKFFKKEYASDVNVSEHEARQFYEAHKDSQYLMTPKVDVSPEDDGGGEAKPGKAAQYYSFDQVKEHIEEQLKNEKLEKLFIQKLGAFKSQYNVVENTASLNNIG